MSTTVRTTPAARGVPMDPSRKTALVAGVCYLLTFVSIPSLILYGPVREAGYLTGGGSDTGILVAAFLEVIVALAGIGTAIVLFPVVKRQNETLALGFVAARTLEAAMILVGVASILSLVTLHRSGTAAGGDAAALLATGASHVATYDWAFTLGQSLVPGLNAILLGTLLYRSGLVPRVLPVMGLVGAPLHLTAVTLTVFGVIDRSGLVALLAILLIFAWELSLGVYLVVKGFRPSPLLGEPAARTPASTDPEGARP
ncbi:DUF4386 domain-containing protein [Georgenia sp. Marseille-Q6866]